MGLTLSACIAPPHFITLAAAVMRLRWGWWRWRLRPRTT